MPDATERGKIERRTSGGMESWIQVPLSDWFMKSDWKERFEQAERAFHQLKGLTKKIPASEWTPEYRELANLIHTLGREVFYVNPDDYGA